MLCCFCPENSVDKNNFYGILWSESWHCLELIHAYFDSSFIRVASEGGDHAQIFLLLLTRGAAVKFRYGALLHRIYGERLNKGEKSNDMDGWFWPCSYSGGLHVLLHGYCWSLKAWEGYVAVECHLHSKHTLSTFVLEEVSGWFLWVGKRETKDRTATWQSVIGGTWVC
jgi:hypothetical protein